VVKGALNTKFYQVKILLSQMNPNRNLQRDNGVQTKTPFVGGGGMRAMDIFWNNALSHLTLRSFS